VASCRTSLIPLFLLMTQGAFAEEFSSTNAQFLYGGGFRDPFFGTNTESGAMGTVTLEHYGAWDFGYNYFFLDLYHGQFIASSASESGQSVKTYAEWEPQFSIRKITGRQSGYGPFKDFYLCGQISRGGTGFYANLIGGGFYLDLGDSNLLGVSVYLRKDKHNSLTYQFTPSWLFPFHIRSLRFVFTGYADFAGSDAVGLDFNAQPQLLFDVGKLLGLPENKLLTGGEWYMHENSAVSTHAIQGLVKWLW